MISLVLLHPTIEPAEGSSALDPAPTVSIEGAVTHPGTYELKPGWRLGDLILAAGKMTVLADAGQVELQRQGEALRRFDLQKLLAAGVPELDLLPGDHIVVPEHNDRILLGFVGGGYRRVVPGQRVADFFRIPENAAVLDTTKFDLAKTELGPKGKPAVRINLKKVLKNPRHRQNVQLEPGDIIWFAYRDPWEVLSTKGSYFICGNSVGLISEMIAAKRRRRDAFNASSCCVPVSCNEVGNAGFFTATRRSGWCASSDPKTADHRH